MIILFLILVMLILVCAVRISNNNDLISNNCKDENDLANINNAKKIFRKSKVYNYLLMAIYISTIILIICAYTDIDYQIIDFISMDLVSKEDVVFNFNYFFLPIYIFVVREILIQVKIGEFLLKYFKTEEPEFELDENIIKNLLYKTAKPLNKDKTQLNKQTKDNFTTEEKQNTNNQDKNNTSNS